MDNSNLNLPSTLLTATERLAAAMTSAEPIAEYRQAKARLDNDPQARDLLECVSSAQSDLRMRQVNGNISQADLDHLRTLQRQAQSNRVIMYYAESQQAAIAYLPQVNQEISQLIGVDFASLAGPASC
jgi:cell fate (sporulation/competence/biofilm development) regulator YlbF (YheA/YmcA/DUF963 family)